MGQDRGFLSVLAKGKKQYNKDMHFTPKIEIQKDNLLSNYHRICAGLGKKKKICLAVKSNAYGHGIQNVLQTLKDQRVDYWGVTSIEEAKIIHAWNKKEAKSTRILFFIQLVGKDLERAIEQGCELMVGDLDYMREIRSLVQKKKQKLAIHVHLDTGMGRLGLLESDFQEFFRIAKSSNYVSIVGLSTHFLDSSNDLCSGKQMELFCKHKRRLWPLLDHKKQVLVHVANTGGLMWQKRDYFDMLRLGIGLYGSHVQGRSHDLALKPVMKLTAFIARIQRYPAGHGISYDSTYTTKKASNIAVLNIGYGLGLPKSLSNRGKVLIHDKLYPMVGNVTMDMCMVNLGDDLAKVGDPAVFWGDDRLCIGDQATRAKMIPYELVCTISASLRRKLV